MSDTVKFGLVPTAFESPEDGSKPTWDNIRLQAVAAEELGFDIVWAPDEMLWRVPDWHGPSGWWECVALTGALAAATTRIQIGTWVLSALHRNPGLSVRVAHTLDEISAGRFVLGLGAGHAGDQGKTFGYPLDKTVGRYEEALEIIIPALRGETVTTDGRYHSANDLESRPRGPRGPSVPLMLAGHGPRTMGLAAKHADIWSCYATESSLAEGFVEMMGRFSQACEDAGRDPSEMGKSVGVFIDVEGSGQAEETGFGKAISGSPDEIAAEFRALADLGFDRIEAVPYPCTLASVEAVGAAVAAFRGRA